MHLIDKYKYDKINNRINSSNTIYFNGFVLIIKKFVRFSNVFENIAPTTSSTCQLTRWFSTTVFTKYYLFFLLCFTF